MGFEFRSSFVKDFVMSLLKVLFLVIIGEHQRIPSLLYAREFWKRFSYRNFRQTVNISQDMQLNPLYSN